MAGYEVPLTLEEERRWEDPMQAAEDEGGEDFKAKERKGKNDGTKFNENVLCKDFWGKKKKEFIERLLSVARDYASGREIVGDTRSEEELRQDEKITAILSQSGLAQTTRRGGKRMRKTKKHHKKHTKKHHKKHTKKHHKKHHKKHTKKH